MRLANNTSPAINAGSNQAYEDADGDSGNNSLQNDTDLAGNPRLFDGDPDLIDMGAYEFQGDPFSIGPDGDNIFYVDQNVSGSDGSGNSWDNALPELADALAWAQSWDAGTDGTLKIWVAAGIYYPDEGDEQTNDDRSATFQLISGVEIYGGFAGGEGAGYNLENRDFETNSTILNGDIDHETNPDTNVNGVVTDPDNIEGSNAYHVVTGSGTDNTAILDGFTITAGQANGTSPANSGGGMYNSNGSPTLTGVTFSGNSANSYGAGMYNFDSSSPVLTNVIFTGNSAGTRGGGMSNIHNSSPILTNTTFTGNSAGTRGGGMYNENTSSPTLTNVTFTGNSADAEGGGMYNLNNFGTLTNVTFTGNSAGTEGGGMYNVISNSTLANVIIWDNQANGSTVSASASIFNSGLTPSITYSLIANSGGSGDWNTAIGTDGGNNLDVDPKFVEAVNPADAPTTVGDLQLKTTSPAINTGDPATDLSLFPGGPGSPLDLAGNTRVFDGVIDIIDIGAYEFQGEPQADLDITLTLSEGWRMLSSPVAGQTYAQMLAPLWTQGMSGADYESGDPNVYTWDLTSPGTCLEGAECPEWIIPPTGFGNTIPAGSGFLMYVFTDDEYDGTPDGFDKTLTLAGPRHSGDVSPTINANGDGWTLLGNPYGLPVAFNELERTDVNGVAYVYDLNLDLSPDDPGPVNGNGGAWRSIAGLYGDITDGVIVPGQGFFVQTVASPGGIPSLTFSETDQTNGGEFYGKEKELLDFVRLEIQGEGLYNSAWIRFSGQGSLNRIEDEALELQPLSIDYAILGARKTDGMLMDIAHFPLDVQDLEIPLAVEATQSGSFTITATDLDLPAGMSLYLYDRKNGRSIPITNSSFEYSFSLNAYASQKKSAIKKQTTSKTTGPVKAITTGSDRFILTTTPGAPASELPNKVALGQNYPNPFNPATQISYQLPQTSHVRLEVYDMVGRHVATLVDSPVAAGTHQVNFDAGQLSSGVYLYRLSTLGNEGSQQIFTKKLTLIK